MRTILASFFLSALVVAACGGGSQKGPATTDLSGSGDVAAETCCCKSNPLTSEDGKAVYENGNRMECSSKQGECVDEVQCQATPQPE
ncbi:MAG: hypothetical protein ACKV2T_01550 [Kofleriaceae bacterium]